MLLRTGKLDYEVLSFEFEVVFNFLLKHGIVPYQLLPTNYTGNQQRWYLDFGGW